MTRAVSALVGLLIAAPFYWLLIDTTSTPELIAGSVAAVLAAGAYSAAYLESTENAAIKPHELVAIAIRESAKVPKGLLIVCGAVLSQTIRPQKRRGLMETEPFAAAGPEPHELGLRALVEAFRTLSPDTIVLGTDPDSRRLILHRMGKQR